MKQLLHILKRKKKTLPSEKISLSTSQSSSAKRVYWLSDELADDPGQITQTHQLTQDSSRPYLGLVGKHGLFATPSWWQAINSNLIPTRRVIGTIIRAYRSGQDNSGPANTVVVLTSDGSSTSIGIYANNKTDRRYYSPGNSIEIIYALDDCKPQPNGQVEQAEIALEVVITVAEATV